MGKFVSLDDILRKDTDELTALKQDEYTTEKLGAVPYTAIEHTEYAKHKKQCTKMVKNPDGSGGMIPDIDDDKLMIKVIITAVDKDERSDFTFANEALLKKLGVVSAEQAVQKLLSPGEIYNMAIAVQNLSGFGAKDTKQLEDDIKNS